MMDAVVRLGGLAAGLCQESGIGLELSPDTWAYDPLRRVILVAADDLEKRGADFCAGVIAHEVGHYFISRYNLFSLPFATPRILSNLLNAIEDPRVNTWIQRRYPGTALWLAEVARVEGARPPFDPLLDFLQFCLESAREDGRGWRPPIAPALRANVTDALDRTRAARRAYAETLPGADLDTSDLGPDLAERYRLEVWPALRTVSALALPAPWEQAVRVRCWEALRLANRAILPIAAELLEGDVRRLIAFLAADQRRQHDAWEIVRAIDRGRLRGLLEAARASKPSMAHPSAALRELALRMIDLWLQRGCRGPVIVGGRRAASCEEPSWKKRAALPPLRLPPSSTTYDQAYAKVASQIAHLARQIDEALRPRRRLRESAGFPTGTRLDLRRVMKFDADPRRYNQLWARKTIPNRRSAAVSLLVDLSGSMRGPKSVALLAGTVLLAETLHRLGVPFAINGFQDVLVPFCDFADGLTPHVRLALGEMPREVAGSRRGGNNVPSFNDDAPCLLQAAEQLLAWSATDRLLLVVSDGLPEGRRSTTHDLHNAVGNLTRDGRVCLIGIGLGAGTEHVSEFYPESVASVPLPRFAEEIGGVLRRALLRS
jgi:hypothetical protein